MKIEKILQELAVTRKGIENSRRIISVAPNGYLHRIQHGEKTYFEHRTYSGGKQQTAYVSVKDTPCILSFVKKAYAKKLVPLLESNEKVLKYFVDHYIPDPAAKALSRLPDWVSSYIREETTLTRSAAIDHWLAESYVQNPYKQDQRCISTLRGDCVRSKGERDIADALFRHSLPYRTDCEVQTSQGPIYSDFVIMHPKSHELYYWEHSGMLDAVNYVGKNFDRVARYAAEGILAGERLILTGETSKNILSTSTIEKIIETYFEE